MNLYGMMRVGGMGCYGMNPGGMMAMGGPIKNYNGTTVKTLDMGKEEENEKKRKFEEE